MTHIPEDDIDELLRQVNAVLDSRAEKPGEPEQPVRNFANNYGRGTPAPKPVIPAYNPDYEAARKRGSQVDFAPTPYEEEEYPEEGDDYSEEYEDQYEEEYDEEEYAYEDEEADRERLRTTFEEKVPSKQKAVKKKKKRKGGCLTKLLVPVLLIAAILLGLSLLLKAPQTDKPLGARKDGAVTILLCGTDMAGTRTDTMMLLYLNAKEDAINLVSLPRDTMTRTTAGKTAKLNSAFGRNNGKEDPKEGMENLLLYVEDIIGYQPDGYMLISLEGFVNIVDLMGGVEFDVPQDMFYEDPSQGLYIDLKKGLQTLNGEQAMGLVRFRKGYSDQDLGRVSVQREFITACMKQWLSASNVGKLPEVLSALELSSTTDLSKSNMLWLAMNALKAGFGNMKTATLPGRSATLGGASYYVLDAKGVAELVNEYCNPYEETITTGHLNIAK